MKSKFSLFKNLPLSLIFVIIWSVLRSTNVIGFSGAITSPILMVICFVVLIAEFYKSGDITLRIFFADQLCSVIAIIIATVTITKLWSSGIYISDGIVGLLIFADAVFSPFNSFRTALRNFSGSVSPDNA